MKARFINPYTDYGFKKIFGEEASKPLLIDFLNALLPARQKITTLYFKNLEQLGPSHIDRKAIFDIYCENDKGEKFIVELQKAKHNFFKDRTVYYEGVIEGEEKGRKRKKRRRKKSQTEHQTKIVIQANAMGLSIKEISQLTGLSESEITSILSK